MRRPTTLTLPESASTVLLYGGVFDPPHRAHVQLPRRIRDRLFGRRAWLVYVPAARSPHKPSGPAATDRDRIDMVRLATARVPRCAVWTDEIDRGGPSYWIDTLRRAVRVAPAGAELRFLIGSDQAAAFHRWKDFRDILDIAEPVVMLRPPHRSGAGVIREMRKTGAWTKGELDQWAGWIEGDAVMDASSTAVRGALARGEPVDLARPVKAYIARRGLYGAST